MCQSQNNRNINIMRSWQVENDHFSRSRHWALNLSELFYTHQWSTVESPYIYKTKFFSFKSHLCSLIVCFSCSASLQRGANKRQNLSVENLKWPNLSKHDTIGCHSFYVFIKVYAADRNQFMVSIYVMHNFNWKCCVVPHNAGHVVTLFWNTFLHFSDHWPQLCKEHTLCSYIKSSLWSNESYLYTDNKYVICSAFLDT